MRATFLGTADGHASPGRSHSGVYLTEGKTSLLLDCGAPAAQFFLQKRIAANHPKALWLSHMHSDHLGQFPMLIQSLWLRARREPLTVYAPQPVIPTLQDYLQKCLLFPGLIGFPIVWHGITARKKFSLDHLTLQPFPTTHLLSLAKFFRKSHPHTCFDCYGLIVNSHAGRIVYSADLASPRELRSCLQKPTRALICELAHFPEKLLFEELALAQPINQTLITHYPDRLSPRQRQLRQLARDCRFDSGIKIVKDGQTIQL
jgi:ribonuclease BN (tRNA processing enzyme)